MVPYKPMKDLNVDQIKKLWVLDLAIKNGSLKKAALEAKVSASAVSQSLTALEKSVGKPLLIRDKGTVTPTEEALAILKIARPAFDVFDQLKNLTFNSTPALAWLKLGTYESLAVDTVPTLIQSLKEKLPELKLKVHVTRTGNLLTMIRKGELCSALITEVEDLENFDVQEVGKDTMGLFIRKDVEPDGKGFASLSPGKDGHPLYFQKFLSQFKGEAPQLLSDSFEALRSVALSGAMPAILPHRVAQRDDQLQELPLPEDKGHTGEHRILLVSPGNCDPEETEFIAREARLIFDKH